MAELRQRRRRQRVKLGEAPAEGVGCRSVCVLCSDRALGMFGGKKGGGGVTMQSRRPTVTK